MGRMSHATVFATARDAAHCLPKTQVDALTLIAGEGVEGDCHRGSTVRHCSPMIDPTKPNLRRVHLIHAELFDELAGQGLIVSPAGLGGNNAARGVDLLRLPR